MGIIELILLAVGLSMDAFAVSICKGLETKKISFKETPCVRSCPCKHGRDTHLRRFPEGDSVQGSEKRSL